MSSRPTVPVDLVVNCFERTYREVLAPGHLQAIEDDNAVRFERRTVLINNVDCRDDARDLAAARVEAGEIDRWIFVADLLDDALRQTGLHRADLGAVPYFTDWALVAVTVDGLDNVLLWDADVRLHRPIDWVRPALELMDRDARVLIANPNWEFPNLGRFTFETDGDFHLGHGASDQVMLGRRSELGRPIYSDRTLALRRYPVSHLADIFEARIDSHLRRSGRMRATYAPAVYRHGTKMGTSYPHQPLMTRVRQERDRMITRLLRWSPWRPRHLRQL
ncbi:MAG: hypothetical protein F2817_03870 [Actinobacteria bacterium]|nr:hypothetical protein [Actinomycetota bacterium]